MQKLSRISSYPKDLEKIIFAEEIKLKSQIWHLFDVQEALCLTSTIVHQDFRGNCLLKALLQSNLDHAAKLGFSIAFGLSLTNEKFNIPESLGFSPIATIKYIDYQDSKGHFPFKGFPKNETAKIFFKSPYFHRILQ